MKFNSDNDLLAELLGRIERAWIDRHDRMLVYELSEQHPELRDQLYEFFEDLVLGPSKEVNIGLEATEERVHQWLQSSAVDIAKSAAAQEWATRVTNGSISSPVADTNEESAVEKGHQPRTFLVFLRRRLGKKLPDLARSLPNMSTEFLVLVSRHPGLLPERIKQAFARLVEEHWQIPTSECFIYLTAEPQILRAALRSQPFENEPTSFQELLDRANLDIDQKTFWLDLMK